MNRYTAMMARRSGSRERASSGTRRVASNPVDLVLYVSASSRYARSAQRNCRTLLDRFDLRQVKFEVCDIGEHPERAEEDSVCYTPMLVKRHPLPRTYVVGDLSNIEPLVDLLKSCGVSLRR
jgi:two-component system response regulator GlrR